jgi:integrase
VGFGEIVRLKDGDIDSAQMIIRIVQGKGRKDRHVMLPPELLVSMRQWWRSARHALTRACRLGSVGYSLAVGKGSILLTAS